MCCVVSFQMNSTDTGCALVVNMDPAEGTLAAGETVEVTLTTHGDAVGTLRRTLMLGVLPSGRTLQLPLELSVRPPSVLLVPLGDDGSTVRCLN